jgi:hypothetical protein
MLSVLAMVDTSETGDVTGPDPQEVMREYFVRRATALTLAETQRRLRMTQQAVWKLCNGKTKVAGKHLIAVTDRETTADLFAALVGVAAELATSPSAAIDAERRRLALEAAAAHEPPPSPDAKRKQPRRSQPQPEQAPRGGRG